MTTPYVNDAIFWIEIGKIHPNPYQPRREFDEARLKDLSESIRMYGVLQPLVVTRKEVFHEGGGMTVEYELISGERRLRASKLAGLSQVPALIRNGEENPQLKLEMAIIENLQREDLNPVDRARSFERLAKEFGLKQAQIADKVGKSREYVSNSMRILSLPDEMINALEEGRISEGHTRPLLMLTDRSDEQLVLFKEIMLKKLTVREAESLSRRVATEKIRNKEKYLDPQIIEMEKNFTESLGTRVRIEKNKEGGTVTIDFFSPDDLRTLLEKMSQVRTPITPPPQSYGGQGNNQDTITKQNSNSNNQTEQVAETNHSQPATNNQLTDDRAPADIEKEENEELYSLKNFSI
jgi:ParB family chromosome partitioning protein